MNTFNRKPSFKSAWQILSAESFQITSVFIGLASLNFVALLINWRVEGIADYNLIHQMIFITLCSTGLGGYDILCRRQEFLASLPIKRSSIFFNRLFFAFLLVAICAFLNHLLFSGIAEKMLYQENWLSHDKSFLHETATLICIMLIAFSLSNIARSFSGLILAILATLTLPFANIITEIPTNEEKALIPLAIIAVILSISSFIEYRKNELLKTSIYSISRFSVTSILYFVGIITYASILVFQNEGGY